MDIPVRNAIKQKASVVVASSAEDAYLYISSSELLKEWLSRSGPIAGVKGVEVIEGPYDRPGAKRVVTFNDGATVQEELLACDPYAAYVYKVTDFSDFLRKLTDVAYGEFWFEREDGRTRISWHYTYIYKSGYGRVVLWLFNLAFFGRFMQHGLNVARRRIDGMLNSRSR